MKIFFKINVVFLAFLVSCGDYNRSSEKEAREKDPTASGPLNVILMIGDGMGLSQVSSSFYFNDQPSNFARFKTIGLIKTSSSSHKITDSAAGATAFACGAKTYNRAIGVDSLGNPIKSITEILAGKNYKSGLISTSSITHATPACFFAKAEKRSEEELIASQMPESEIDFFAGGGLQFFSKRKDQANYLDSLKAKGYTVDTTELLSANELNTKNKYGFLLADEGMPRMTEGRGDFLKNATVTATDFLGKSENGFFLMVEGSQIDWGGHANEGEYVTTEVVDFDKTIGAALDFAEKNGNTLVIVTADHETGGFTLASETVVDDEGKSKSDYAKIAPSFSTGGHSGTLVPVFAYGPGAENFSGVYENTEIFHKILALIGE